jgi:tetratricopeptide (TPR) repeat protein
MLAYHYSSAEELVKAEEYMIKAGDEALKSSASSEAIHYYQEAIALYGKNQSLDKDPEKTAAIEKNLAIAFFNKGQYENALIYFDRALKYYGDGIPGNKLMIYLKFIFNFVVLVTNLFFPIKKSSRIPGAHEWEIIKTFHKRLTIIAVLDPRRFFIESIYLQKMLIRLNLKKVSDGIGMFSSTSNTFSWTGISYRISKKILDYHRDEIPKQDKRTRLLYNFSDLLNNFLTGDWHNSDYNIQLINDNLKDGELFFSSVQVLWDGYIRLEQGFYNNTIEHINMLSNIGNIYNHDYTIALKYELHTRFLIKYRELDQAVNELKDGIAFTKNTDILNVCFVLLTLQVRAFALLENFDEAEKSLKAADDIKQAIYPVPFHLNYYLISKFTLFYNRFRKALSTGTRSEIQKLKLEINVIKKSLLSYAGVSASDRVEAYRLVSNFYNLTGKYSRAFKYIRKSILEGENLNARVELARTYCDAGNFLLTDDNHYKEVNGCDGMTYIEKSSELFEKTKMIYDKKEQENKSQRARRE